MPQRPAALRHVTVQHGAGLIATGAQLGAMQVCIHFVSAVQSRKILQLLRLRQINFGVFMRVRVAAVTD
jgi:hypothetical protein